MLPFKNDIYILSYLFFFVYFCFSSTTDPSDQYKLTENTRKLGLVVCRGTQITLICPIDGMEEIANPFEDTEEELVIEESS